MTYRKAFMVLALALLAAGFVLAEGQSENSDPVRRFDASSAEKLTLTGRLSLEDDRHPVLVSEGREYELMVPWFYTQQIELEDGEQVTVEGYRVPGPRWADQDGETYLRVTRATIRGQEYDLGAAYGPMMGGRSRGPMMGGRPGPRGGGGWGNRGPRS